MISSTLSGISGLMFDSPLSEISGLLFDSPFISPLLFSCLVLLLFLSYFLLMVHSPDLFPENTQKILIFCRVEAFFCFGGCCWAAVR